MKYLQLFENWNPLSKSDIESVRYLNSIGVVSDKELRDMVKPGFIKGEIRR